MARTSAKRAKTTATPSDDASSESESGIVTTTSAVSYLPFQSGPRLDCIPDDVLHEILSHLPTLTQHHVLFGSLKSPPVIPSAALVRTPVLRALSQTSRLLRSRCLALAWRSVELCNASLPTHNTTFHRAIGDATKAAVHTLNACPHLWPLVQTVTVVLSHYQSAKIVPAFAACLAVLPNLTTIQVVHARPQMTTAIRKGFEGQRFPSVRKACLPCSAHHILLCLPNIEEVICTGGPGSTIIKSLIKGDCRRVHTLKSVVASLTPLIGQLPNLRHFDVPHAPGWDMKPLADFPLLDTIEITSYHGNDQNLPLAEFAAAQIEEASDILKANASRVDKTVIVTYWKNIIGDSVSDADDMTQLVIKL